MQTLSPYHIEQTDLHELYQALQHAPLQHLGEARQFLRSQLQLVNPQQAGLPDNPAHLLRNNARTTRAWRDYLLSRKQGQPRRYFSNRAHALYFLHNVAATKLVDGAWLYGLNGSAARPPA